MMLQRIIQFSVRNKLIIGLLVLSLIGAGIYNVSKLSVDALPDITSNQVQVITISPALAAPEVERLVTFPVEQATATIPGIREMRSMSRFGLSVVTIVFDDATDLYWARQQISERLISVTDQIPASAGKPELAPITTGLGEIYQYILRPAKGYESKYDLTELRSIQDWIVRRQLMGTPGVADISSFGGYLKQYEVAISPDRLKSMNISIDDVFHALEMNNQNGGGAYIEKGPAALFIRTEGLTGTLDQIRSIMVRSNADGIPVYLKDVAEVRIGHAVRYGAMTYNDRGEVAGAVVLMLKGANASEVVKQVKTRIEEIKKTLPEGVILEPFYDRTKMVDRAMHTVKKNLLEGALIVIFVLVLFLGNLRAGLLVASVIPLAMLFAIILMNLFGVSGNLMSLGALDFGLIVDGAVIIVEAVMHRVAMSKTLMSRKEFDSEVENTSHTIMNAAVFGQVIILIVYLPILTLVGIEGKMFRPMAQTVSFALIGAFLLSLTYVPMMSSLFLPRKAAGRNWSDRLMDGLQRRYQPLLARALRIPKLIVGSAVLIFAFSVWILTTLGGEFIPELEEGDFAVDARGLTGSSLGQTVEQSTKAATILTQRFPEVEKVVTRIGASEIPTDPMPMEMTDVMISLKPKDEWTSAGSYDELAAKMSTALSEIPGMTTGFQFPVQMRFNELISGARQDVVCKIFGENLDSLAHYAKQLAALIRTVDGPTDLYVETVTGLPQIVVRYDREQLARYQLNIADVNRAIRSAFAGESAGTVYEQERRYDLVVRLQESQRGDVQDVSQLLIASPLGLQIPLNQVAKVTVEEGPNQIQRENASRRIIVGFNVRGRDVESVVTDLQNKVGRSLKFSPGYYLKYGGQFENLSAATGRLAIAVPVALLLILFLLYLAFGSLPYGLLIFSAIPLSAIGGILALWIRGMPFSISAGIGFIALFGVAVLNGVVLMSEFQRIKMAGETDTKKIIQEGTSHRLRPVLMTASVASLGFLPMALSHGAGAEVQRPLATVVIGGLLSATLLTLFVLPILFQQLEKWKLRMAIKKSVPVILVLLALSIAGMAQEPMPAKAMRLQDLLNMASEGNLHIQALRNEKKYWKEMEGAAVDLPKTDLISEYGQMNSFKADTRFALSQGFSLPVLYSRNRDLYRVQGDLQQSGVDLAEWQIKKQVARLFYQLVDLSEREHLLMRLDSIYSDFRQAAKLRFDAGESNRLEHATANLQAGEWKLQLDAIRADRSMYQEQLRYLLQAKDRIEPAYDSLLMPLANDADSFLLQSPELSAIRRQQELAIAQTALEKARLLPDFSISYFNQSIIGFQSISASSQKYYNAGNRFHSAGLTVGIPLFNRAGKARIRAAAIQEKTAVIESENIKAALEARSASIKNALAIQRNRLNYYQTTGVDLADELIRNANLAFREGNIDYLEWTMLMDRSVNLQLQYLETVRQYNQLVIDLTYLTKE